MKSAESLFGYEERVVFDEASRGEMREPRQVRGRATASQSETVWFVSQLYDIPPFQFRGIVANGPCLRFLDEPGKEVFVARRSR